jgi:hypothetical protein
MSGIEDLGRLPRTQPTSTSFLRRWRQRWLLHEPSSIAELSVTRDGRARSIAAARGDSSVASRTGTLRPAARQQLTTVQALA